MADRYWVGGTGTWNTTSTTNWSASSGGASGASVPTVADNVFFDQAGTYTVTMTGALACLDITVSAGTVTFATGTSPTLDVRGSMTLAAATVWSSTGNINALLRLACIVFLFLTIPYRNSVPPPDLAGYAPVSDVLHPREEGVFPCLWNYPNLPFSHNTACFTGHGLNIHIPLQC